MVAKKIIGRIGPRGPSLGDRQGPDLWLELAYLGLRLALAVVFIYAGAAKLQDVRAFAAIIDNYGMVPHAMLPLAAVGLPIAEVIAGVGLILEIPGSLSAVTAMLLLFAAVLWFGVLQGLNIDCGCFSADELAEHDSLRQALYRDLGMLATAAFLFWWRMTRGARFGLAQGLLQLI